MRTNEVTRCRKLKKIGTVQKNDDKEHDTDKFVSKSAKIAEKTREKVIRREVINGIADVFR